jgi:hypothetical protein
MLAVTLSCSFIGVQAADTVNYADYYDVPLKEESSTKPTSIEAQTPEQYSQVKPNEGAEIQKGLEFAVAKELSTTNHVSEVSVKNEYPESLKVVFEATGEKVEIYLNAYELMEKLSLNQNSEYKIKVYNIYNEYLGYIRSGSALAGQLKISPFLLVRDSIVEAPTIKFVREEQPAATIQTSPISKPEPVSTESKAEAPKSIISELVENVEFKDEFAKHKEVKVEMELNKRSLRVANISDSQIHIDITEQGSQRVGEGWTVANDTYEPQFLTLKSQPIQISNGADLIITKTNSNKTIQKKAQELNIDEKENYVWLIDNLTFN